jgi:hypothetical protein
LIPEIQANQDVIVEFRKSSPQFYRKLTKSVCEFVNLASAVVGGVVSEGRRAASSAKTGPLAPFCAEDVVRRAESNKRRQR